MVGRGVEATSSNQGPKLFPDFKHLGGGQYKASRVSRNAGYSSLQRHLATNDSYASLSSSLLSAQATQLQSQLAQFQAQLSTFSSQHRAKILSSPAFRQHFSTLCAEIGVDPLGGGSKGLWDKLGAGLGEWYYALGVQVVDVCLRGRERGGGLVALEEVMAGVEALRSGGRKGAKRDFSQADIKKAIETLEPLGCGYALLTLGEGRKVVRCYPGSLDRDAMMVVDLAGKTGRGAVSQEEVYSATRDQAWSLQRVERALEKAVLDEGMAWIDDQAEGGPQYWVPALFAW